TVQQHVIGPLDRDQGRRDVTIQQVRHRQRGGEGQLRRFSGRFLRQQQQRGEEIAAVAAPLASATATASRLPPRRDPQRADLARLGAASRLGVGGVGFVEDQDRGRQAPLPDADARGGGAGQRLQPRQGDDHQREAEGGGRQRDPLGFQW